MAARPDRASAWLRTLIWAAAALLALAVAIGPDVVNLPSPHGAIVFDHATYLPGNGASRDVKLPNATYARLTDAPPSVR